MGNIYSVVTESKPPGTETPDKSNRCEEPSTTDSSLRYAGGIKHVCPPPCIVSSKNKFVVSHDRSQITYHTVRTSDRFPGRFGRFCGNHPRSHPACTEFEKYDARPFRLSETLRASNRSTRKRNWTRDESLVISRAR